MHDLTPITALGGSTPQIATVGGLTLSENPDLALASVATRAGHEDVCHARLVEMLGGDLPNPGHALLSQPFSAVWMGPGQWMIGAAFADHENLAEKVKDAVGAHGSVTEQTDAWVCFDLSGEGIEAVLELCCNVNIRAMQTGDAQRTSIHHLGCFVICGDPAGFVRILGPRSSAASLYHALKTAMVAAL